MTGKWTQVEGEEFSWTEKMEVPGGWIYRTGLTTEDGGNIAVAMVFVPDPEVGRGKS